MTTILEEEYDPTYSPTEQELIEYSQFLGIALPEESDFLWIAREGLKAPLPNDWKPCKDDEGNIYYFNFTTGESVWDHPADQHYKELVGKERKKKEKVTSAFSAALLEPIQEKSNESIKASKDKLEVAAKKLSPIQERKKSDVAATLKPLQPLRKNSGSQSKEDLLKSLEQELKKKKELHETPPEAPTPVKPQAIFEQKIDYSAEAKRIDQKEKELERREKELNVKLMEFQRIREEFEKEKKDAEIRALMKESKYAQTDAQIEETHSDLLKLNEDEIYEK